MQITLTLGHVEALEDLTLVGSTVTVHGEGGVLVLLAKVLLGEGDACAEWHLSTNDAVATEESAERRRQAETADVLTDFAGLRRGEDVPVE